ncbi:MAG TPA: putative glycoside hydrolase [Acidimicrobiia bacterium]|nr:putative glycoside hydrolase [Acidimicrobiia bacterium]
MNRVSFLAVGSLFATLLVACVGEPGGGGVNIELESSTTSSSTATTTTSIATTTTTTTIARTATTTIPTRHVTGRVSTERGSPVAGANVSMGAQVATTGADGGFSFEIQGLDTVTVTKPGWTSVEFEYDETVEFHEVTISAFTVRGIRVSPESAGDDDKFERLLQLGRDTAVNTLVFDTKQEGGVVVHDVAVEDAHQIGAVTPHYDAATRIEQAHSEGLYTITRIVVFDDAYRASAFPEERLIGGWLSPTSQEARSYVLSLAVEACEIGFDEIQFDYIRYPSGATADRTGQLDLSQADRVAAIATFLGEARSLLNPMGCAVSGDVFGVVVSMEDDQGLGQRPEELSAQLDVLSPMVYPSHYSNGWLGYEDPNDHPYEVTADAIADAIPRLAEGSTLRPWLQAFWWTNEQIRTSIQAAEDHGVGWILWNVLSNFDVAALPSDDEVGS